MLTPCEAELTGWKVCAKETLALLLLGGSGTARDALIVRLIQTIIVLHIDILRLLRVSGPMRVLSLGGRSARLVPCNLDIARWCEGRAGKWLLTSNTTEAIPSGRLDVGLVNVAVVRVAKRLRFDSKEIRSRGGRCVLFGYAARYRVGHREVGGVDDLERHVVDVWRHLQCESG